MEFIVAGDFVVTKSYYNKNLLGRSVRDLFGSVDFRILNLEAPISKPIASRKIRKTGPHLRISEDVLENVLEDVTVNLFTLANNHILDYGEEGLKDTLDYCKRKNINVVGAGLNMQNAQKPFRLEFDNTNVSIINFAENEWASATSNSGGAAPMDIIDNVKLIQKEKKEVDLVILIIHGGHEYYNLPSPRMQKQYRFYADSGADLIIGHHTHCISGFELYNNTPIYYSLGNFLFTTSSTSNDWYNGIALKLSIMNRQLNVKPYFLKQEKETFNLHVLEGKEYENVKTKFEYYSGIIKKENELLKHWNTFINLKSKSFLRYWSPLAFMNNGYLKALINKMGILKGRNNGRMIFLNLMRCQSHYDLSKAVLKNEINKKDYSNQ